MLPASLCMAQQTYRYRHAVDDPLGRQKSQVLEIRDNYVVRGTLVDEDLMINLLQSGIKRLSGLSDPNQAWRRYLHEGDTIAIVFNRRATRGLSTNTAFADALLQCLYRAGFKPEQFLIYGLDELGPNAGEVQRCAYGWQTEKTDFGSNADYLAQWLEDVTAIINVPTFMEDNILGLRGTLANVTLPLVKSPSQMAHVRAGGDPFVADIYDLPQIQGKIRLTIANALHVLYAGGPVIDRRYVFERRSALFCDDPVALDRVGLGIINIYRQSEQMPPHAEAKISAGYLLTAEAMGLGYYDLNRIDYHIFGPDKLGDTSQP